VCVCVCVHICFYVLPFLYLAYIYLCESFVFLSSQLIDLEGFVTGLHICEPTYNLLWNELKTSKFQHMECFDNDNSMGIDDINMTLADTGVGWREKTRAMRVVLDEITKTTLKSADQQNMIKKVTKGFMDALRSQDERIIFAACYTLARLSKAATENMKGQVGKLLRVLWELLDATSPLILHCAHQCVTMLIRFVPDSPDRSIFKTVIQGALLKGFNAVQITCFDSLSVFIERNVDVNDDKEFWEKIKDAISEGISLSDSDVKLRAFHTLMVFDTMKPTKAAPFLKKLSPELLEQYAKAKNTFNNTSQDKNDAKEVEATTGNEEIQTEKPTDTTQEDAEDAKEEAEESADQFPVNQSLPTKTGGATPVTDTKEREPVRESFGRQRAFSTVYGEHKTQLDEIYAQFDEENKGFLTIQQTEEFLKEMGVTGQEADITLRGLDVAKIGQIQKKDIINWCLHKSPELINNPVLEKEAMQYGWMASKEERLEQRLKIYQDLMQLDKLDSNYNGVFDCDMKIAVLQYLLDKCKRTGAGIALFFKRKIILLKKTTVEYLLLISTENWNDCDGKNRKTSKKHKWNQKKVLIEKQNRKMHTFPKKGQRILK
ncbi:hypothetical protein RFI_15367, partial [Reticulomyxa filosa]